LNRENTIYLSGPMSGLPNYNHPAFNAVARHLRSQGYEVYNPAELVDAGEADQYAWTDLMRMDIAELTNADTVAVLKNWDKSRGASLEVLIAVVLEMDVVDAWSLEPMDLAHIQAVLSQLTPSNGEAQKYIDPTQTLLNRFQILFERRLRRDPFLRIARDKPKMREVADSLGVERGTELLKYFFRTWLSISKFAAKNPSVGMFASQIEPMEQYRSGAIADDENAKPYRNVMHENGFTEKKRDGIPITGKRCEDNLEHRTVLWERNGEYFAACYDCRNYSRLTTQQSTREG